jgi:DNA-binding response OmpR family regulator
MVDDAKSEAKGTVLIVDDQPANLAVLARLLGDDGYKVRAVTSGERALEAARLSPPECVLLDVAMPGMDGFATCEAFQRDPLLAEVPIVFVTAFDDPGHRVRAFRSGGRDFVTKPFQAEEVLARVGCHLRLARADRERRAQNASFVASLVEELREPLAVVGRALEGKGPRAAGEEAHRRIHTLLDAWVARQGK